MRRAFRQRCIFDEDTFFGSKVITDLESFIKQSDVIVANRITDEIRSAKDKIYTRDIFESD